MTTIYIFFGVVYLILILWGIKRRLPHLKNHDQYTASTLKAQQDVIRSTYHKELPSSLEEYETPFIDWQPNKLKETR